MLLNAIPIERASAVPIVKRAFFILFFMETSSITRSLCGLAGKGAAVVKITRNACGRAATFCFIELHLNNDSGGVVTTETTCIQQAHASVPFDYAEPVVSIVQVTYLPPESDVF